MASLQTAGIFLVFFSIVALLMTRKLSVMMALPIAAVLIAMVAGIPFFSKDPEVFTIASDILEKGSVAMASTVSAVVFGAFFGQTLNNTGISKSIIRKAAELAGDKQFPIAIALLIASAFIFSGATFVGITIMVGTIILPIMISVGIPPLLAATVLLCGQALGSGLNVSTWAIYMNTLNLDSATMGKYTPFILVPMFIVTLLMIIYYLKKENKVRRTWAMPTSNNTTEEKPVRTIALISPIIPITLVLAFELNNVPALLLGIIFATLLSTPRKPFQMLSKSFVEGIQSAAGAIAVVIGVGIIMASVRSEQVLALLEPVVKKMIPTSALGYIALFGLLAPLALYRGPLNMFGMGSGLIGIFAAVGMNPIAAMVGLRTDAFLQVSSCPTNSQNIWVADFTKTDTIEIMKRQLIFIWAAVCISLIITSFMLF